MDDIIGDMKKWADEEDEREKQVGKLAKQIGALCAKQGIDHILILGYNRHDKRIYSRTSVNATETLIKLAIVELQNQLPE